MHKKNHQIEKFTCENRDNRKMFIHKKYNVLKERKDGILFMKNEEQKQNRRLQKQEQMYVSKKQM